MPPSIAVVYGAFINPRADWRNLIRWQLDDLERLGLFSVADLHVVVSNPAAERGVERFFAELPFSIAHRECRNTNQFEFPALSHAWNLAHAQGDRQLIAYLHTKGISYARRRRDSLEKALTQYTFANWTDVLRVFAERPEIHKIGLFPARDEGRSGWMWFNFWWARAGYIRGLPEPEVTPNRYYYESWLGTSRSDEEIDTWRDCYSRFDDRESYYTADQACAALQSLKWRLKYGRLSGLRAALATLLGRSGEDAG